MRRSYRSTGFLAWMALLLMSAGAVNSQAADGEPCTYRAIDIGKVEPSQAETAPGPALVVALDENPTCEVVAVNFVCHINDMVKDYKRLFYDRNQELLVLMTRTSMKVGSDSLTWRIWYGIAPTDFSERLPYGRGDLRTKGSPYSAPKATLLVEYKGPQEATDWP